MKTLKLFLLAIMAGVVLVGCTEELTNEEQNKEVNRPMVYPYYRGTLVFLDTTVDNAVFNVWISDTNATGGWDNQMKCGRSKFYISIHTFSIPRGSKPCNFVALLGEQFVLRNVPHYEEIYFGGSAIFKNDSLSIVSFYNSDTIRFYGVQDTLKEGDPRFNRWSRP